ncbi:hypothetical protein ACFQ4M_10670 [Thauera mechernichensis]|uniref:Uncharacterized protein n=1 Tax=Thauera mechernichensis TaxID=82788 RepID=A0ABW3WE05_9RHOO|nr:MULTISPECIES: hypothetical protein [Thauera]MDG3066175.1 hypothetical protein [Thauera mechernichensis]
MKILSLLKRLIGIGADAGHHLANLVTFVLAVIILLVWAGAYFLAWLRGLV